jgi:hypothetical protein
MPIFASYPVLRAANPSPESRTALDSNEIPVQASQLLVTLDTDQTTLGFRDIRRRGWLLASYSSARASPRKSYIVNAWRGWQSDAAREMEIWKTR